jgi:hypothetical protein
MELEQPCGVVGVRGGLAMNLVELDYCLYLFYHIIAYIFSYHIIFF